MLRPGTSAPSFELPDQDGKPVRLSDRLRQGPLVLYFYPADFTPGCTREACAFRDRFDELFAAGLGLLGVSPQDSASHARFRAQYHLPFDLLADPQRRVFAAYDALGPFGLGVRRVTYLIDRDGVVRAATGADFRIGRHAAMLDALLRRPPA